MKKLLKLFFGRALIIGSFIILQFVLLGLLIFHYNLYLPSVQIATGIIGVLCVIHVCTRPLTAECKLPWAIFVLIIPVFGSLAYIMFSKNRPSRKRTRILNQIKIENRHLLKVNESYFETTYSGVTEDQKGQANYIYRINEQIPYTNNKTTFFSTGELFYEDLLAELRNAEKFIFMEYFIIGKGKMLDGILEILKEKAKNGVDVRVLYDDVGSIGYVPVSFARKIRKMGIKCYKFNRFLPIASAVHNNRDHRKITVIDGKVAYTGGINISDEYINEKRLYGVWKDSAIKVCGPAVDAFTYMFMELFCFNGVYFEDISKFTNLYDTFNENGVVIPYGDGPRPLYDEVGKNIFINMINSAKKYIWITTPYLICDSLLKDALRNAALRGVDVRIVMPHIPDKKVVFTVSRSNYKKLMDSGVKIYEYTPGFVHAKQLICDDNTAIVGTVNFDYRSLVHHFENGVLMFNTESIKDVKADFENYFNESIDMKDFRQNVFTVLFCKMIAMFQPLL